MCVYIVCNSRSITQEKKQKGHIVLPSFSSWNGNDYKYLFLNLVAVL